MKTVKKAKTNIKDFFTNFKQVLRRQDMIVLPGNLSFFFVLAIIPLIGIISYSASILDLSTAYLYNFIKNSFSVEIADIILGSNLTNSAGIHFIITFVFGMFFASNGADSIITTSNTIYGIKNRPWFKRRLKAIGMSVLIVILLMFMLIVPVFGDSITNLINDVNLNQTITDRIIAVFNLLKGPISWIIMFISIKIIYAVAPDKKPKNRVINYGALFTTFGWIVGTKLYSLYATRVADYSALYGGIAGIIVLMIWIYYLCYIFTIGIALNSKKDEDNLLKTATIDLNN